jgi:hypothetical protein
MYAVFREIIFFFMNTLPICLRRCKPSLASDAHAGGCLNRVLKISASPSIFRTAAGVLR